MADRARQLAQARERADQAKRDIEQLELQTAEAKVEEKIRQKDRQKLLAELERLSKEESTLVSKRIQLDEAILKIMEQKESLQEQLQGKMLSEAGISSGMAGLAAPSASPPKKGSDFDCLDSMDLFKDTTNALQSVAPVQSQGLPDLIGLDAALSQPAVPPQQAGLLAAGFLTAAPAAAVSQMPAFGGMESGASSATSANFLNASPCAAPGATGGAWGGLPANPGSLATGPAFPGGYAGSAPAQGMPFPSGYGNTLQQQFQQPQQGQPPPLQFQHPQQGQPPPPQFQHPQQGQPPPPQFQQLQQGQPPPPPLQQQQQGTADDFSRLLMGPLGR